MTRFFQPPAGFVAPEEIAQCSPRVKLAVDDGEIRLVEFSISYLTAQLPRGGGIACEHHQPAHRRVEAVHGARLPAERGAHERGHAARLIRGENARRLYADSDPAVVIEYIHICLRWGPLG